MGRRLAAMAVVGVLLLFGAIVVSTVIPAPALAVPMVVAAGILFAIVVWAIFISAWRTKGWSLRHPGREG